MNNLHKHCVPEFYADICQGWTQETLRQVYITMTKKGSTPIKLWFESPEEMRSISNKRGPVSELFEWLNYRKLGRIDTLELVSVILMSIEGKPDVISMNIMLIFGFHEETGFTRDEFFFFIDTLFRGLMSLSITKDDKQPVNRGKFIRNEDIEDLVKEVFANEERLDRPSFVKKFLVSKTMYNIFIYFHEALYKAVLAVKQRNQDRIQMKAYLRRMLNELQKSAIAIG
mmetsp:Transcript_5514/g.3882  ORF Transcript_5514/g.3882 Transcript_5514/m.3882 type:complete len:228 (+) Transcript_5514:88-771(+)